MKKTILFPIKMFKKSSSGPGKHSYYLIKYLISKNKYNLIVISSHVDHEIKSIFNNVKFVIVSKYLFFLQAMFYVVFTKNIDFFYTNKIEYLSLFYPVLKIKHIKSVYCCHGFVLKELKYGITNNIKSRIMRMPIVFQLYKTLFILTLKDTNIVICVSKVLKDYLRKYTNKKTIVIRNAIDNSKSTVPKNKNYHKILYVGGYNKHKGIFSVISLAKKLKTFDFYIYGSDVNGLKQQIEKVQSKNDLKNLHLHDFSENIDNLFAEFEILFYPSKLDNLPFAIIEAMKYKMLIVSSLVGELQYFLKDNKNCLSITNIEDVAAKLQTISRTQIEKIQNKAYDDFEEQFLINNVSHKYLNLFK
ncbi:MAG: glycosyltransferase family 4 protein [Candidatus Brocadiaceae bacterium]|nr:glycosyltransferase family 4 protein [Candidatus Brocadiaceae bacterium]